MADQPIVLIVPSSALAPISGVSEAGLKRFIADRIYELTGTRDPVHWLRQLDWLLTRPRSEGPVLTLFFDGLNQEPSFPWLLLLKVMQGEAFQGRVRIMISTRKHHFENKLTGLRGLFVPASPIAVEVYDTMPGGELDQMLAFDGLTQADLHPDLVELARTPRLFKLVVRLRDRLVEAGQVTVHRLLWEYGRDTFGERAGKSFSESEWRAWLAEIANRYRSGVQEFSLRALSDIASRPDLTEREVYARLSDIIDGQFARPGPSGSLQLTPTVVAHSLGAALLAHLDTMSGAEFAAVESEVVQWLDPIAGLDQRAEILRAAVSILIERGGPTNSPMAGVLVTAWLQTQNGTESHGRELGSLAPNIPEALLDAVEQSDARAHASARLRAINALRAIPRAEGVALSAIVARVRSWLSIVSRQVDNDPNANPDLEKRRSDRYRSRIGSDESGWKTVLGVELQLVDRDDGLLQASAPSLLQASAPAILEGFPLAKVLTCFEAAAVAGTVRGHVEAWGGLKWLCYLNEVDPGPMADALRALSTSVRARAAEAGVHPGLPARAAAILLMLSGLEADEEVAASIDTHFDNDHTYQNDYLADPSRSFFALERRHADNTLIKEDLNLWFRIKRTKELWLDPTFQPPPAFVDELRAAALVFKVERLTRQAGPTQEDYLFEEMEPVLARCAPDLLAELIRRKLQSLGSCPAEPRYWSAIRATDHFILAESAEASAARALRLSARDKNENHEAIAASNLLKIELLGLADTQSVFDRIIAADLKFIPADFVAVIPVPTAHDVDVLIARYHGGSIKQQRDLIVLLSVHPIRFSDGAWSWLSDLARQSEYELRGLLFRTLTLADAVRFGRMWIAGGWSWDPKAHVWVNHYGSGALIAAGPGLPFDHLAALLAPWRVLEAARVRGADVAEVRLAAEIFGRVIKADKIEDPDPGAILTVDRTVKGFTPIAISVKPTSSPDDRLDADEGTKAFLRADETARVRIEEARKSGASLYLSEVASVDMEPVLEHASDLLELWIEGSQERTADFQRRVRLAEPAYLAMCETLLIRDPQRGAELWRALRASMATRYIGAANVDELLHMAFRVPDSVPVSELRDEVISLPCCHTDQTLLDIAIAASYNDNATWLSSTAAADQASTLVWQKIAACCSLALVLRTPCLSLMPGRLARSEQARLTFVTKLRCFVGEKPAPITGGKPTLRRKIVSRHMRPGYYFFGRLIAEHGRGCTTTMRRTFTQVTLSASSVPILGSTDPD